MIQPFPGMNPYLEALRLWPDVQASLSVAICHQIQLHFGNMYVATLVPYLGIEILPPELLPHRSSAKRQDNHLTIAPVPLTGTVTMEMPTRYHRIEIRTIGEELLVTAIELLSPVNKRPGADAADAYDRKRRELFRSDVHLLEIDLLRGGRRPAFIEPLPEEPYFIFLSRAERRPAVEIWPIALSERLPIVPIPLRYPDEDIPLDLNAAITQIYNSARYDYRIDYRQPPPAPELDSAEAAWVDELLRAKKLRTA